MESDENINLKIATILGIIGDCSICGEKENHCSHDGDGSGKHHFIPSAVPDFCNDLNEMSTVEKSIQPQNHMEEELVLWSSYERELRKITLKGWREGGGLGERLILASARERAEAFLNAFDQGFD